MTAIAHSDLKTLFSYIVAIGSHNRCLWHSLYGGLWSHEHLAGSIEDKSGF